MSEVTNMEVLSFIFIKENVWLSHIELSINKYQ